MYLIDTVSREDATGVVAAAYGLIPPQIDIPVPLRLMSASPALLERQVGVIGYFRAHERLSPPLLASIRYVASQKTGYAPCAVFNAELLRAQGMSEADMASLSCKPAETPLEESEAALLAFVTKSLDEPQNIARGDVEALLALGWRESDVLDAVTMAANMLGYTHVYRTFVRS